MKKTKKLRQLFKTNKIIRIVGAHDGLGAKLIEKNGFDGVWASGFEISTSYTIPDANILTMTQYLERAIEMNDATSIPVVADCDTGYGNSNNVIHLIKKYESAGIAAVCIEDKKFPKVNSYIPGRQELAPVSEFIGKIMAAKNAQENKDFMVIARTEALISGAGMKEALTRAKAYADAGADAILLHSKSKTIDEVMEFLNVWDNSAPIVIVPTTYYKVKINELDGSGIKMVIYANQGIRASIKAINEVLETIYKDGTTAFVEEKIGTMKEVFQLQGMPQMQMNEKKYLYSDKEPAKAIILAAGYHGKELTMKILLKNLPATMLDINGKSILQWNIETLNKAGVQDIVVVRGFKKEKIDVEGVRFIDNDNYAETYILSSLFCAKEELQGRVIVSYSDILYDEEIITKLLSKKDDITIVIDRHHRVEHFDSNKLELVVAEKDPIDSKRTININRTNYVKKIGTKISSDKANYEFIGLALFSEKGINLLKEVYRKAKKEYKGGPFHESSNFKKASFSDILQEMIDRGYKVSTLEVYKGWMEVHTFKDYKTACHLYSHL